MRWCLGFMIAILSQVSRAASEESQGQFMTRTYLECAVQNAKALDDRISDAELIVNSALTRCEHLRLSVQAAAYDDIKNDHPEWLNSRSLKVSAMSTNQIEARVRTKTVTAILEQRARRRK